jgi:UPF0755 protein
MVRKTWRMLVSLVLFCGLPLVGLEWYMQRPVTHPDVVMEVTRGMPMYRIAQQLEARGAIDFYPAFILHTRLRRGDRAIQAGEYQFEDGLTPLQIYDKLTTGMFKTYTIRMIEGWTYRQMAQYLSTLPFVTEKNFAAKFIAACEDPVRIASLDVAAPSLEGFLFPNTYKIHRPRSAEEIVDRLVSEFGRAYNADIAAKAKARGMSQLEVVTLASIIEKETGAVDERRLVSGVFHNRLKRGMKLETDPSVTYGIKDYDGIIHRSDLNNPHPYNTYIHPGLPPGPIANPGRAALEAAVDPAESEYLFFVSRNDGTHIFSSNYRDHSRAVQKFQR